MRKVHKLFTAGTIVLSMMMAALALTACSETDVAENGDDYESGSHDKNAETMWSGEYEAGDLNIVQKNEKEGALDKTGKQVIPYEYDWIGYVGPDRYLLFKSDGQKEDGDEQGQWAIVNSKNEEIIPFGEYIFKDGYYNGYEEETDEKWIDCIAAAECGSDQYGFYSVTDNAWAIEPVFKEVDPFNGPITAVKAQNDRWGFIDSKGEYVIPPKYKDVDLDSYHGFEDDEDIAPAVTEDGRTVYVLKTGEELCPTGLDPKYEVDWFHNGCFMIRKGETSGVADKNGNIIIPVKYEDASSLIISKNFIAVHVQELDGDLGLDSKWILFDHRGNKLNDEVYSDIAGFDSVCVATITDNENEKYGMLDENGAELLPCEYEYIGCINDSWDLSPFDDDDVAFAVCKNEASLISLYNKKGEELIHEKYEDVFSFPEYPEVVDICAVQEGGKIGFIDRKGKTLLEPTFEAYQGDSLDLPRNPCFWGKDFGLIPNQKSAKYAVIDKDFNRITDYKYTDFGPANNGLFAVRDDKGWSVINTKGEEVIPSGTYEEIDTIAKNGTILVKDPASGKYGLVDYSGKKLTEFKYEVERNTD